MGKDNTYSDVGKTNMVFGGIKVLQVVVSFLKTKVVAMCLGPAGMGVQTLLGNTINTIYQFTNCGTAQSGVRAISSEKDAVGKTKAAKAVDGLSFFLGLFATFICFFFAKRISILVFGSDSYTFAFRVVSFAILLLSVKNGQITLFQGYRNVKVLAKAAVIAAFLSFLVTIPLVYFGRESAIPYIFVASYSVATLVYVLFRKKHLPIEKTISNKDALKSSGPIVGLGLALMLSNSVMSVFALALTSFINRTGTSADVGLFGAANVCTYNVISILISTLASDFFPRVSSVTNDRQKVSSLLSAQVELLILLLVPIVLSMILVPELYIRIFYSSSFLSISNAVKLMAISLLFRIIWHSYSYIILARGDKVVYFVFDALIGNGLFFVGNIFGFKFYGIDGIALSYIIFAFIVMSILGSVVAVKYHVKINKNVIVRVAVLVIICGLFYLFGIISRFNPLFIQIPVFFAVSVYCLKKYNEFTGIISSLISKLWRKVK